MVSLDLDPEGVWVIRTWKVRWTEAPVTRGRVRRRFAALVAPRVAAGPPVCVQLKAREEAGTAGPVLFEERRRETPPRAFTSGPALATIATGSVEVGAVDVVLEGGSQFVLDGVGAVAPGQGLSCPNIVLPIGPNPFASGPMLEKSLNGGTPPGVTSSGKIHSVTG